MNDTSALTAAGSQQAQRARPDRGPIPEAAGSDRDDRPISGIAFGVALSLPLWLGIVSVVSAVI